MCFHLKANCAVYQVKEWLIITKQTKKTKEWLIAGVSFLVAI